MRESIFRFTHPNIAGRASSSVFSSLGIGGQSLRGRCPNDNCRNDQEFYKDVILEKLNPGGIFVTQSAAAGVLSHTQVRVGFSCSSSSVVLCRTD